MPDSGLGGQPQVAADSGASVAAPIHVIRVGDPDAQDISGIDMSRIDMESMAYIASRIDSNVPSTEHHRTWRLALFLRYQTPTVNKARQSFLTWEQIGRLFYQDNWNAFRSYCLRRVKSHSGHGDPDFNIFIAPPDQPRRPFKLLPDSVVNDIISQNTLQRQLCMTLDDRVEMFREELEVLITV